MARPKSIIRPVEMSVSLPEDLHARLMLELYSEVEGRVPHGKISRLFGLLLRQHFEALDSVTGKEEQPCLDFDTSSHLSWDGMNIQGDEKSILFVKQAIHEAYNVPQLKERIKGDQAERDELAAQVEAMREALGNAEITGG